MAAGLPDLRCFEAVFRLHDPHYLLEAPSLVHIEGLYDGLVSLPRGVGPPSPLHRGVMGQCNHRCADIAKPSIRRHPNSAYGMLRLRLRRLVESIGIPRRHPDYLQKSPRPILQTRASRCSSCSRSIFKRLRFKRPWSAHDETEQVRTSALGGAPCEGNDILAERVIT